MEVTLILPEALPAGTHKLVLGGSTVTPPPTGGGGQPIPPVGDKTYTFPWGPTFTQDDEDFTLVPGSIQTIRFTIPNDIVIKPGHTGFIKVFAYPSGNESNLNSRVVKNGIVQRAWYTQDFGINLQEDYCIGVQEPFGAQLFMPGDTIDFQFKTEDGRNQPVRCTLASPNRY